MYGNLRYLVVPISLGLRPAGVPWRPLSPPSLLHSHSLPVCLLSHRCPGGIGVLFDAIADERDERLGVAGYDVFERRYVWPLTGRTAHAPAPDHHAAYCTPIANLRSRATQASSTPLRNERRLSIPPGGGAQGHLLQANDSRRQVRAHHTPPAAPLAPPAPATRPEASQPPPAAPLPSSGPFPEPCRKPYSRMQPSLPPRHRSNRFCPPMPCRAARARAQNMRRLWRRVATADDDLGDGRRRRGQRRRLQAIRRNGCPTRPSLWTSLAAAPANCRLACVTGRARVARMQSFTLSVVVFGP